MISLHFIKFLKIEEFSDFTIISLHLDKSVDDDELDLISKKCSNTCKGNIPLTVVYGQNNHGSFMFMVEMNELVTQNTKGIKIYSRRN